MALTAGTYYICHECKVDFPLDEFRSLLGNETPSPGETILCPKCWQVRNRLTESWKALDDIRKVETLVEEALDLFNAIPSDIQVAIFEYQNAPGLNIPYLRSCLEYSLVKTKQVREDWHIITSKIKTEGEF